MAGHNLGDDISRLAFNTRQDCDGDQKVGRQRWRRMKEERMLRLTESFEECLILPSPPPSLVFMIEKVANLYLAQVT